MDTLLIKQLMQLMFGKISSEDFRQLRSNINTISDDDLQSAMEAAWEDPRTHLSLTPESNQRIMEKLQQHIPPKAHSLSWLKFAAAIFLPLLLTWGTYWIVSPDKITLPDMTIMAESGHKTHLVLPDGSKVWLNSLSSLSYPADFGVKNRTVRLIGEGYFEVTKDETKAFHVETENVNIVVHGTKFNVSAHVTTPETRISLVEGSVSVEDKKHHLLTMLSPNQSLHVDNKNLQFDIVNEDTHLVTLWRENKCRIENASAEEMFKRIGYWYGLNIHLENDKTEYNYGFTIKEESFRELLELINELTPLEYNINGEEVTIWYK